MAKLHFQQIAGQETCDRVWFGLHGSGRTETDMAPLIRSIDPLAAQIALRGSIPWGDGFAFFRRHQNRMIDTESLIENAAPIEEFVRNRQRAMGPQKTYLIGVSNGAIMASVLLLRRRIALDGVILFRPAALDFLQDHAETPGPPVLILEGLRDERRKPSDALALADTLRHAGFQVSRRASDCGHSPDAAENQIAKGWLRRVQAV